MFSSAALCFRNKSSLRMQNRPFIFKILYLDRVPATGLIYSNSIRARDKSNDSRFLSPLPSIFFLSFPLRSSTPPSISRLLIIPPTFYCSFRSDLQINLYGRKNRCQLTCFWDSERPFVSTIRFPYRDRVVRKKDHGAT